MSVIIAVYLDSSRLVSAAEWDQAIKKNGFEIEMATDFEVRLFSGFLPCKYKGEDTGFEYCYSEAIDELEGAEKDNIGERHSAVVFVTHSDLKELATATIAAGVLCSITDGVLFDDGNWVVAGQAIDWCNEQIREIQKHIA